jgi:hypothetical protein
MSDPVEIVLVIFAIGYVLVRRLAGQPAEGKRMLLLPAVLIVIGLTSLAHTWSPVSIAFLVGTTLISVVLGILRGVSIRISERDGIAFMRYTGITVALWIVNIAIKLGASVMLGFVDHSAESSVSSGLLLSLGAGILMEGLVVLYRALHTDTQIIWSKGKDGASHTTSPFLDNLQRNGTGSLFDSLRGRDGDR